MHGSNLRERKNGRSFFSNIKYKMTYFKDLKALGSRGNRRNLSLPHWNVMQNH